MKTYFKVEQPENEGIGYIDTKQNIIQLLDVMEQDEFNESYLITPIQMTEEEFNNLPEFGGF